jgi:hypothetical protein
MPKEARPPSSKSVVISLSLPWTDDRAAFIRACVLLANKEARLFWDNRTGRTKNKGGRPTVQQYIYSACDEIWEEWGGRFPARNPTLTYFLQKAKEHTKKRTGKPISPNTLKKHVKGWMDGNITIYDAPRRQRVQHFNIQWLLGITNRFLASQRLKVVFEHMTEDQLNQPVNSVQLADMFDARTQALIEDEWAKNPAIQEAAGLHEKLRYIASVPKGLKRWKQRTPSIVDEFYSLRQIQQNALASPLPGQPGSAENPKKLGKATTKK